MTFKKILFLFILIFILSDAYSQTIRELNNSGESLEYDEVIDIYKQLGSMYNEAELTVIGTTDIGRPLHLFVINKNMVFNPSDIQSNSHSTVLFINNGIHPGEPDGIDASVRFSMKLLEDPNRIPDNVIICIVPVFNIGGALNRGCCSRANQNGPKEYGFRGNARNLDLNRDFIKCDASNTRSLVNAIRAWNPDVFIDTHVSNGADYQYTMTLLTTQPDKLGGVLTNYLRDEMLPELYRDMDSKGHEMTPYIHTAQYGDDPRKGVYDYMETPRYTSGFCALFGTISFVTEAHMLKPFTNRVDATEEFLTTVLNYLSANGEKLVEKRLEWKKNLLQLDSLPLKFVVDSTQFTLLNFKGYESYTKVSPVTNLPQMYYDPQRPYEDSIRYYNIATNTNYVSIPQYYIIPGAWNEVVSRLSNAGIIMERFKKDTSITSGIRYVISYETKEKAYEGHYLHHDVQTEIRTEEVQYYEGDYLVSTSQDAIRYIIESLEPEGEDSFFSWGFFDSMLQQKEWFSSYVFDGYANELLQHDEELKAAFEKRKKEDTEFAGSSFSQLYFLYQNSPLFEGSLNRYPVGMIYK
jgi:hypothetical protein